MLEDPKIRFIVQALITKQLKAGFTLSASFVIRAKWPSGSRVDHVIRLPDGRI